MLKFATAAFVIALVAVTAAAQAPTLQITLPDGPDLPAELWYGNVKVKPLRIRPGTNTLITIDDSDFFAAQHYVDFLGRFADQGGLGYWTDQINGPCNGDPTCIYNRRAAVSAAFFFSLEFQQTGYYVYRFYAGSLGRQPLYPEFQTDRRQVVGGGGLNQAKAAYADAFVLRPEFLTKYPASLTPSQFVDAVLATMLAYNGTNLSSQRATYIATVTNFGRGAGTRQIIDEASFQTAEFNPAFVLMSYFGYLRREKDQGGYLFWLDVLNNHLPGDDSAYRKMVCAFETSAEYQLRFSSTVTQNGNGCNNVP
jgi:hypothetical protein